MPTRDWLSRSFVGSAKTVKKGLGEFIEETKVEEVMVNSAIYDHPARLRSYEILSGVMREFQSYPEMVNEAVTQWRGEEAGHVIDIYFHDYLLEFNGIVVDQFKEVTVSGLKNEFVFDYNKTFLELQELEKIKREKCP